MAAPYNLSPIQNGTNLADQLIGLNTISGNLLGIVLLVAIFAVFFIRFLDFGPKSSFATSSLIVAVLSLFFAWMSLISFQVLMMFIILAGVGALMLIIT